MKRYVVKRIFSGLLTVLLVFTLNFVIIKAAPGDPIKTLMGKENSDPQLRAALEEKWGLNQPQYVQYFNYLRNAVQGDLGTSITYNQSVNKLIAEKVGPTVLLGVAAAIVALFIGTAMGIYCARHEEGVGDTIFSGFAYTLDAMPSFWLGLMLILIFASRLGWFPTSSMTDVRAGYTGMRYVADVAYHMVLPCLCLIAITMPGYFRIAKSSVLQVTNEDFITTLRATGMDEGKIFRKYIFRNAILPTITTFGITLAFLITGVTLIEIVFAWPGMGRLTMTAINQRDYPTLLGIYLIVSVAVSLVMILVDIVYALFDPRIRFE